MGQLSISRSLNDKYIFRLTDDTGMLQHSKHGVPNPAYGYTTDDNARALIMAVLLYEKYKDEKYLDLIYRYSSFLLHAQNEKGRFRNFMSYDRKWLEEEGSEDCFGRCIWALGFAISSGCTPHDVKNALKYVLEKALPNAVLLDSLRGKAYSITGLAYLGDENVKQLISVMAESICRQYDSFRDGDWKWFENIVAYSNGVLPRALFAAYRITGDERFCSVAEESLEFLEGLTFKNGYFKPVGCNGWFLKGKSPAQYDEQPVEACETALAYLEAYEATGKKMYIQKAKECHLWYEGRNSKDLPLVDANTGGCFDGLTNEGVNMNMGAESLVSYVISFLKVSSIEN
ncbi:MAG TPA: glycosyltransferase [Clostridiaceae bacterium]|nr:glycosyltransferase [Clostridiaceae bacterium]